MCGFFTSFFVDSRVGAGSPEPQFFENTVLAPIPDEVLQLVLSQAPKMDDAKRNREPNIMRAGRRRFP